MADVHPDATPATDVIFPSAETARLVEIRGRNMPQTAAVLANLQEIHSPHPIQALPNPSAQYMERQLKT